jgi:hypothetical protein
VQIAFDSPHSCLATATLPARGIGIFTGMFGSCAATPAAGRLDADPVRLDAHVERRTRYHAARSFAWNPAAQPIRDE